MQIFRIILKDAAVHVRHALSENLKSNSTIPRDVDQALAADVDLAALPILEYSPAMTAVNPGAEFTESALDLMLDRHRADPAINWPLAGRAVLPVRIAERLTALVADELCAQLMTRHKLNIHRAMELVLATRERAMENLAKRYFESDIASLTG